MRRAIIADLVREASDEILKKLLYESLKRLLRYSLKRLVYESLKRLLRDSLKRLVYETLKRLF